MLDSRVPDGGQWTHQGMRGFSILVIALAVGRAAGPYVDSLPATTVQYGALAVLMVAAYGIYLVVTSPLIIELMERGEAAVVGGDDDAE